MKSKANKPAKQNFPSTEPALYFVEDIMERCMTPFVLLGQTAYNIKNNLDQDLNVPIEIGIKRQHLTEYSRNTMKMFLPPDTKWGKKAITFEHLGVLVTMKIIDKKWSFLSNPNHVYYKITQFKVPNPFDKYWKARGLVR